MVKKLPFLSWNSNEKDEFECEITPVLNFLRRGAWLKTLALDLTRSIEW
jgi:hypothetical protein